MHTRDFFIKFFKRLLVCIMAFMSLPASADDGQLWLGGTKKVWQSDDKALNVLLYGQTRATNDVGDISGVFMGPIVRYKLNKYLDVGGGYKLIYLQGNDNHFEKVEFEITPKFSFGSDELYKVSLRNRFEIIKEKGERSIERSRYRFNLTRKFNDSRYLKYLYFSHESIYTPGRGMDQFRLVPLGANLRLSANHNINIFYMLDRRVNSHVEYRHILGLNFSL